MALGLPLWSHRRAICRYRSAAGRLRRVSSSAARSPPRQGGGAQRVRRAPADGPAVEVTDPEEAEQVAASGLRAFVTAQSAGQQVSIPQTVRLCTALAALHRSGRWPGAEGSRLFGLILDRLQGCEQRDFGELTVQGCVVAAHALATVRKAVNRGQIKYSMVTAAVAAAAASVVRRSFVGISSGDAHRLLVALAATRATGAAASIAGVPRRSFMALTQLAAEEPPRAPELAAAVLWSVAVLRLFEDSEDAVRILAQRCLETAGHLPIADLTCGIWALSVTSAAPEGAKDILNRVVLTAARAHKSDPEGKAAVTAHNVAALAYALCSLRCGAYPMDAVLTLVTPEALAALPGGLRGNVLWAVAKTQPRTGHLDRHGLRPPGPIEGTELDHVVAACAKVPERGDPSMCEHAVASIWALGHLGLNERYPELWAGACELLGGAAASGLGRLPGSTLADTLRSYVLNTRREGFDSDTSQRLLNACADALADHAETRMLPQDPTPTWVAASAWALLTAGLTSHPCIRSLINALLAMPLDSFKLLPVQPTVGLLWVLRVPPAVLSTKQRLTEMVGPLVWRLGEHAVETGMRLAHDVGKTAHALTELLLGNSVVASCGRRDVARSLVTQILDILHDTAVADTTELPDAYCLLHALSILRTSHPAAISAVGNMLQRSGAAVEPHLAASMLRSLANCRASHCSLADSLAKYALRGDRWRDWGGRYQHSPPQMSVLAQKDGVAPARADGDAGVRPVVELLWAMARTTSGGSRFREVAEHCVLLVTRDEVLFGADDCSSLMLALVLGSVTDEGLFRQVTKRANRDRLVPRMRALDISECLWALAQAATHDGTLEQDMCDAVSSGAALHPQMDTSIVSAIAISCVKLYPLHGNTRAVGTVHGRAAVKRVGEWVLERLRPGSNLPLPLNWGMKGISCLLTAHQHMSIQNFELFSLLAASAADQGTMARAMAPDACRALLAFGRLRVQTPGLMAALARRALLDAAGPTDLSLGLMGFVHASVQPDAEFVAAAVEAGASGESAPAATVGILRSILSLQWEADPPAVARLCERAAAQLRRSPRPQRLLSATDVHGMVGHLQRMPRCRAGALPLFDALRRAFGEGEPQK